jgi:hypothetical protein
MFAIIVQIVAIIKRHLFAGGNIAHGHDPDAIILELRFGVRRTTVIDEAREVALHTAINIELLIDVEDIMIAVDATAERLVLGESLPCVFDDRVTGANGHFGKKALAFNPRSPLFQNFGGYFFVIHWSNPICFAEK